MLFFQFTYLAGYQQLMAVHGALYSNDEPVLRL